LIGIAALQIVSVARKLPPAGTTCHVLFADAKSRASAVPSNSATNITDKPVVEQYQFPASGIGWSRARFPLFG
jgi:hypothetical protein